MMFRTTKPCTWNVPRRSLSECERRYAHGPLQPMKQEGLFSRLFRDVRSR